MNKHILLAIGALGVSMGAQAAITVTGGTLGPSFIALSAANVTGGAIYPTPSPFPSPTGIAAIPKNDSPAISTSGNWLAAGKASDSQTSPATLSLVGLGATAVSFLWGSPDSYNSFSVATTSGGPYPITAATVQTALGGSGVLPLDGKQDKAYYVSFSANTPGEIINSISFISVDIAGAGTNAIEISNVTVVPEPEAYGLALAGMGVVAFAMRRRRAA